MNRVFEYFKSGHHRDIIVVEDEKEAKEVEGVLAFLDKNPLILPDFRPHFGDDLRSFKEELLGIITTLHRFYSEKAILIAPTRTLEFALFNKEQVKQKRVEFASSMELHHFKEELLYLGYEIVDIVETQGEVSFRGDIIDIFSPNYDQAIRLSLFDTEIESLRFFDVSTQKSFKEELEQIDIAPAFANLNQTEWSALNEAVEKFQSDALVKDIASIGFWLLEDKINLLEHYSAISYKAHEHVEVFPKANTYKSIEVADINALIAFHEGKKVTIIAKNEAQARRSGIKEMQKVNFIYNEAVLNLLSNDELIISLNKPSKKRRIKKSKLQVDLLNVGDYVVHKEYGVAIFEGIEVVELLGAKRDFVKLKYQGDDKLLLPTHNLDSIDKYVANSGVLPILDKLGKGSFARLKSKVSEDILKVARGIVELSAKRELLRGVSIQTTPQIQEFQHLAGFEYTPDQAQAIEAIFADLASDKVMDRLISADVGFGKTEIAMNAIFSVAKANIQSALIVPTTLLSNQHFNTLSERFSQFDIRVAKLDRFVSAKDKKITLKALEEGAIDVVVGTHALFGATFKNLGLIVIDEEHKFGVKQKEKLKAMSENIHLLSMSATPIPRSLNLALSNIKSLSTITTPPTQKKEVRTFVKEYNDKLIKEIILREMRRAGQIFYIFNSIEAMEEKREELLHILPKLKITMLHSKVAPATTEKEILKFAKGEYDLLLSTSIVESGLHLPNVNTIVVEQANNFGLADLHQLRGRVGRGRFDGYCYFLIEDKERLSEVAKKRLLALESNSFLGSGSVLAYHDLEIRGGGNILGVSQSGHIKNIGYSLYMKMLEDSINALVQHQPQEKHHVDIKLNINAYLSSELISEDRLRIDLYKRLSDCYSLEEVYEIEEEIGDRFGKLDSNTKQFIDLVVIKILALMHHVESILNYHQNITITFKEGKREIIKSFSKDDDDIIEALLKYLRAIER